MFWLLAIFAYLLGSLSFAILLSRLTGNPDPRMSGSGNAGATNRLRLAGKKLAVLTLLGDAAGPSPVLIASLAGLTLQQQAWIGRDARSWAICFHCTSLSRWQGRRHRGRHAAGHLPTGSIAVAPRLPGLLTFYLTRTSSLAALIATPLTLPLLAWQAPQALLPMSVLTLLIVWRHRGNLRDLFAGRERHF